MRKQIVVIAALTLAGCTTGYWPKVEGDTGARYQSDVRDCQTETISTSAYGWGGAPGAAMASNSTEGRAAIDACMTKRGYRVTKTE